jgi:FkbM family methyltransferase
VKPTIIRLIKNQVRQLFIQMNWPVTRNLKYDILTKKILDRELTPTSNCIDVGAHKGEILDLFLHYSPQGKHHAFEPIPAMYEHLTGKYAGQASIYPYALSNREGTMLFNVVLDAPAYSGLQRREYKTAQPEIHSIEVEVRILDHVLQGRQHAVDLIKIDVEGGEMDVLKGATSLLTQDKPMLIFEFGKGASEYYGTLPHHMHEWLSQHDYAMWTLEDFWKRKAPLSSDQLKQVYESGSDYYFVAQSNAR